MHRPQNNPGCASGPPSKTRTLQNITPYHKECQEHIKPGRAPRCIVWEALCFLLLELIFPSCLAYLSVCLYFFITIIFPCTIFLFVCEGLSGAQRIFFSAGFIVFRCAAVDPRGAPCRCESVLEREWERENESVCVCTYTLVRFRVLALESTRLRRFSPRQQGAPLRRGDHQGVLC